MTTMVVPSACGSRSRSRIDARKIQVAGRLIGHHEGRPASQRPGELAGLAGRKPHAILRAFPELGPAALRQASTSRRYTREDIIWQRLADDHGVIVAYPTLRTYITSRRRPASRGGAFSGLLPARS